MDKSKFISLLKNNDKENLIKFINEESAFSNFREEMIRFGDLISKVDIPLLAEWFLNRSRNISPENVLSELEEFLVSENIPGRYIVTLKGINLKNSLNINKSIRLVPITELKSLYRNTISEYNKIFESLTQAIVNINKKVLEETAALECFGISSPCFTGRHNINKEFHLPYNNLHSLCSMFALIGPCAPSVISWWWEPNENIPYSGYSISRAETNPDIINSTNYDLTTDDENELVELAELFLKFNSKNELHIPLNRLNRSLVRIEPIDQLIELAIAMESLFLKSDNTGELGFRLRTTIAKYMEEDIGKRQKLAEIIKKFYSYRSKAVHKGKVEDKDWEKVNSSIDATQDILINALKKIIKEGDVPDWDKIILK
ncbi:hypothetical protein Lrub_0693 [Legionella rubrilucens]|uniref:Uncharacterized protein n=1 Tax=Legionella rubrilucens TaxID=458 RepID=A0A0W0XYG1_9GAMM|nr:HEPN domain-containing protein [Legionella rubrilucens]KTD49594.1 hypothetical protein Lrub_0693 [Legionella rubrilucens]